MQDNKCGDILAAALKGKKIDILINNAGYFYEPVEKVDSLNFEEVRTCIRADICVILWKWKQACDYTEIIFLFYILSFMISWFYFAIIIPFSLLLSLLLSPIRFYFVIFVTHYIDSFYLSWPSLQLQFYLFNYPLTFHYIILCFKGVEDDWYLCPWPP